MASINLAHAARKSLAMGPSVRNLLSHYQLDPAQITSTGPHSTLLKGDVLSYIDQNQLQPMAAGHQQQQSKSPTGAAASKAKKSEMYVPNLDISGYTPPNTGPAGFSKIAKKLLDG